MNRTVTRLAGILLATSTSMRRLVFIATAILALALVPALAHAQQVPGTLLDPAQVEPALRQAIRSFSVDQAGSYVGDCGLYAPDISQLCSEVFVTADGAVYVELIDVQNTAQFLLQATLGADGIWRLSGDSVTPIAPA